MGKISKKIRKIGFVNRIMVKKREITKNLFIYRYIRNLYLQFKWQWKFKFSSQYQEVRGYLRQNYYNSRVSRPDGGFSDFDIAVIANLKEDPFELCFLQILTNEGKKAIEFNKNLDTFLLKHKYYNIFHKECVKRDKNLGRHTIETIKVGGDGKSYSYLLSSYRKFVPLKSYFRDNKNKITASVKESLIAQLKFYLKVFNDLNIFWSDSNYHNIMIIEEGEEIFLVPIDFIHADKIDVDKAEVCSSNQGSCAHIEKYILANGLK